MKFRVRWDYRSSIGGPWLAGDVVDVDPGVAEAIGKDSPGVLTPSPLPSPSVGEGAREMEKPPRDRMVRRGDRKGDPGDQGAMTRAEFKAVKD